ncbi:MAG: Fic family protein [Alphaproteobacteria bacterium]
MSKTQSLKNTLLSNKTKINDLLSGANTVKRLNNLNYLCQQISFEEPKTLIQAQYKDATNKLDYTNMKNLSNAYNYILDNLDTQINYSQIFTLYGKIIEKTNLDDGALRLRRSNAILNIPNQDSIITYAPNPETIYDKLNNIVSELNNTKNTDTLTKAFNVHYQLILLQPFTDCNKRLARFVMNWYLMQNEFTPIVFNNKKDKLEYINSISAYIQGNSKTYTRYMEKSMLATQKQILNLLNNKTR